MPTPAPTAQFIRPSHDQALGNFVALRPFQMFKLQMIINHFAPLFLILLKVFWERAALELASYLRLRAWQLLYEPITLGPAGEQRPEKKWNESLHRESIFSGMSRCSWVATKSWFDSWWRITPLKQNEGFLLKRQCVTSDRIPYRPLSQLFNLQTICLCITLPDYLYKTFMWDECMQKMLLSMCQTPLFCFVFFHWNFKNIKGHCKYVALS